MANILIVDDSRTSRRLLRSLIEAEGHTVIAEAKDGKDAIEKAKEVKPDIITLDITMPVMDGVDALKEIRAIDKEVKIIMISAAGQKNKIIECLREGANEFITKPFEVQDVKDTLARVAK